MQQKNWDAAVAYLLNELKEGEHLAVSLAAEDSLFVRITQARVRQSTEVQQGFSEINYFKDNRTVKFAIPFTFVVEKDIKVGLDVLKQARELVSFVPEDPFIQLPFNHGSSQQAVKDKLSRYALAEQGLSEAQGYDFVGLLATGEMVRANLNSAGLQQWFETSTFSLDFSFYTSNQQAVKGLYGGQKWDNKHYKTLISTKLEQLEHLTKPIKILNKGKYRTYFAPSAVAGFLKTLSWGGVSQEAYQRGHCALKKLVDGEKTLSPCFSLRENFLTGEMPRFNEKGEIAPEILSIIDRGAPQNLLCSSRSSKEYGLPSNFASASEGLRAPEILPGRIPLVEVLDRLETGLYVSHLHYLNWSDIQQGRITGMTRFGCFWVEGGKIIAPVKDMRFDESLYHFWGKGLVDFTAEVEAFPETSTYFQRDLGILKAPGMIVNDFTFVSAG
jgi:predicted Zn-dependent protease